MPQVGVIDVIEHLPLGVLTPLLDANGPFGPGSHSIVTWLDGATVRNVSDTFGVVVRVNGAFAPELGLAIGFDDGANIQLNAYVDRIVQVSALHQLLGGAWVPSQIDDVFVEPSLLRWVESLPGKIGLYVGPTWHVDLFFLRAL